MTELQGDLVERFRWVDGHADMWRLFDDARLFARIVDALANPFRDSGITKVAGIEARGFILAAAVAVELGAGFVAIRKPGGLLPGAKVAESTAPDYRGNRTELRLQLDALVPDDRVLLVDDWFETGSQASAAVTLIERAGGDLVGASVIVDQLGADLRGRLGRYETLIAADVLPDT